MLPLTIKDEHVTSLRRVATSKLQERKPKVRSLATSGRQKITKRFRWKRNHEKKVTFQRVFERSFEIHAMLSVWPLRAYNGNLLDLGWYGSCSFINANANEDSMWIVKKVEVLWKCVGFFFRLKIWPLMICFQNLK